MKVEISKRINTDEGTQSEIDILFDMEKNSWLRENKNLEVEIIIDNEQEFKAKAVSPSNEENFKDIHIKK